MNDGLHTPASIFPGKETPYPVSRMLGGPIASLETVIKKSLPLQRIEPIAWSLWWPESSWFAKCIRASKSRKMKWTGYIALVLKIRSAYLIFGYKSSQEQMTL